VGLSVQRDLVERRHELVGGVERHLGESGVGPTGGFGVHPQFGGQHHEGRLGGIADHGAVVGHRGVAVQAEPVREPGEFRRRLPGRVPDVAGLGVTVALDHEPVALVVQGADHHLVLGQRPGLVGVDRAGRAEGLHIGEVLHHGL
jgi:hypothetical protein